MMDWTDRHCRLFHRTLSRRACLYTEMVTAPAILHGDRHRLLDFDPAEQPVVLQLGGSDPGELGRAARIAGAWGYHEINLNVGCPSDRVQSGCFGAVLMKSPDIAADCVSRMIEASPVPVSVKCRIGVDDQIPGEVLPAFLDRMRGAGVCRVIVHARKAWLQGLDPRENRTVPPLDHALVHSMKRAFPDLHLSINGGIAGMDDIRGHLTVMDGVMVGRAAYHQPWQTLGHADRIWGETPPCDSPAQAALAMRPHILRHLSAGGRLHQVTRHMLGLFHGLPGARAWKRTLSENAGGGIAIYDMALREVTHLAA